MLTDFSEQHSDRDRSPRGRRDLAGSRIQEHGHAEHVPAGVSEEHHQNGCSGMECPPSPKAESSSERPHEDYHSFCSNRFRNTFLGGLYKL